MPRRECPTLVEAVDTFLLEDFATSTRKYYQTALRKTLKFFDPDQPVKKLTRSDVLLYIRALRDQDERYVGHPRRPVQRGPLSPRTISKYFESLSALLAWCVKRGYLKTNPADGIDLRRSDRPAGTSRAATPEELQAIRAVAEAKAKLGRPQHLALFLFFCDTGARAGEADSLVADNLFLDQGMAWVIGKGDKMRPIFFGPETADALRVWMEVHKPEAHEKVFAMDGNSASQVITRMAEKAGIVRPLGAHSIRHRVGQVWAQFANIQEVQLKLGHEDPAITIEYYYNTPWESIMNLTTKMALAALYGIPTERVRLPTPRIMPLPLQKTG